MPGSNMGDNAIWRDPNQIKRRLYEKVQEHLAKLLDREVDLVIEKDKHRSGSIYASMYSEAWTADVYLVDLTGANVNVYLELGVRWAMSDGVTVLLAQDPAKLPFNVVATRAQLYSNDPDLLENSISRVVKSIIEGLEARSRGETDSPVREHGQVQSISAHELAELKSELQRLRAERGEGYMAAAAQAPALQTKIDLLRHAVDINPLVAESRFQLGQALRQAASADAEAIEQLEKATQLSPETPEYWRELGTALSKAGQPEAALRALERSVDLDPSDFEALSVLGGAQRRLALRTAPDGIDWQLLRSARDHYEKASRISPRDTYPLLNVARLDMLLGRIDSGRTIAAKALFCKVLPLSLFELQEAKEKAVTAKGDLQKVTDASYKAFDYADCLLFCGQVSDGLKAYQDAVHYVPAELRRDIFRSVLAGLTTLAEVLEPDDTTSDALSSIRLIIGQD
jgi:tetratricopeptide (TPR) repeat protein